MLISCTSVAVCQILTAFLLWRVEALTNGAGSPLLRCSFMWLASVALILLGLAESALDWKCQDKMAKDPPMKGRNGSSVDPTVNGGIAPPTRSKMDGDDNGSDASSAMSQTSPARNMSLVTEEDESVGKGGLRLLHALAAFAVVGFNIASQWSGGDANTRPVSAAFAFVGGMTFFVFCMMVTQTATTKQRAAEACSDAIRCTPC